MYEVRYRTIFLKEYDFIFSKNEELSSVPDTSDKHQQPTAEVQRRGQEELPPLSADAISGIKRRLWEETANGLGKVVRNLRVAWYKGDERVFYKREEQQLEKYLPLFQYGLALFVFSFFNFRATKTPRFQKWRTGFLERIRPSPPESLSKASQQRQGLRQVSSIKSPPTVGYLERKRKQNVDEALNSMKYFTDFLVSLSIGTSATLFLLERKCGNNLRTDFEEAPLVAGRSLIADKICPGMLELCFSDLQVRKAFEDNQNQKDRPWEASSFDPNLHTFFIFINNCQKRKDYESSLRQQMQQATTLKSGAILIPHTGVQ
ncbi:unnamed protein product [Pseudo-nitzschia multistriata]|uniref:Uncharacterized protein n=1 Tax=Pseudo-nitzschia multistriata TaxID=183589 RepID=A0A448YXH3_9STRA|nr:unnamed protein product [Pseudo-nitzschia multistriata]